jgi:hypothetical protein
VALAGIGALLLGLFIGANEWIHAARAVEAGETRVYWISLAAAGLLVWLTVLTFLRSDEETIRKEPATATSSA